MPKSVSSAVTHRCHHQLALPFREWHPFTKPVPILARGNWLNFCTSWLRRFVPDLEVWYLNLKVFPTECSVKKSNLKTEKKKHAGSEKERNRDKVGQPDQKNPPTPSGGFPFY